ncbi:MAG: amino acid ABC transporter permease [Deltaproteobacteria bacterium]|jgi:polar amino acid transport system permease protein|nr:amino acid ABC transporter permease [Deltaproteobacteria bacterium]MBT4527912.1 amino acid ABC transporter permease [Deltaproteobacteria bacterium]
MIFQDTINRRSNFKNIWFNIALLALFSVIFYWMDLRGTSFAKILISLDDIPLFYSIDRIFLSVAAGLIFYLNARILDLMPLKIQMFAVWIELALVFLLFFYSFDLKLSFILKKLPYLITQGVFTTVYISVISVFIAFCLALAGAISKLSSNGFASGIANFYTSFFRGLPLLMQLYLLYMGLPQLGFVIDAIPAGIIALSLCYGAYMTEIFRAGILSINKGQWEAARAMALTPYQIMRHIILPQSMPVIIPPTGNMFIAMLKDSSLVSILGVWELMYLARTEGHTEFRHFEMLVTVALIYWMLSIILEIIQGRIEKYFHKSR